VRSGPGGARIILLLHIISARPSKQPLMVRTFLKVYMELGSSFLFLQEQIKDIIIIIGGDLWSEYIKEDKLSKFADVRELELGAGP
jgi:hypothetical protein